MKYILLNQCSWFTIGKILGFYVWMVLSQHSSTCRILQFWSSFQAGALLSTCWLNGEITIHPLLFDTSRGMFNALEAEADPYTNGYDEFDDANADY